MKQPLHVAAPPPAGFVTRTSRAVRAAPPPTVTVAVRCVESTKVVALTVTPPPRIATVEPLTNEVPKIWTALVAPRARLDGSAEVTAKGAGPNVAVTDLAASVVSGHVVPVPVQAPVQPRKVELGPGEAVSVTDVPFEKLAEQVGPQSIPTGVEVTVDDADDATEFSRYATT